MQLTEILDKMTSDELEKMHEYVSMAINIFADVLPQDVEVERMIASEEYRQLFYIRTNVFYQLAKREQERRKAK